MAQSGLLALMDNLKRLSKTFNDLCSKVLFLCLMKYLYLILISSLTLIACTNTSENISSTHGPDALELVNNFTVEDTTIFMRSEFSRGKLVVPIISAPNGHPKLDSLIYEHYNFHQVTSMDIPEAKQTFENSGFGIRSMQYFLNFNANGIFDLSYDITSVSAYATENYVNIALDLHAQKKIELTDLIRSGEHENFLALCNKKLMTHITQSKQDMLEETGRDSIEFVDLFNTRTFEHMDIDFSIKPGALVVYYDFYFPQYAKSFEPNSVILLNRSELKPFINLEENLVKRWLDTTIIAS